MKMIPNEFYYVNNNPQPNGDHELHASECSHLPDYKKYVGNFSTYKDALKIAKTHYPKSKPCYWCCREYNI